MFNKKGELHGSPFFYFFFLKRICIALFNTRPVFRCKSSPAKGGLRAFRYSRGYPPEADQRLSLYSSFLLTLQKANVVLQTKLGR